MYPSTPSVAELTVDNLLCQLYLGAPAGIVKSGGTTGSGSAGPDQPQFDLPKDPQAVYEALLGSTTLLPLAAGAAGYILTSQSEKTKASPLLVAALAAFGADIVRRAMAARQLGQRQNWYAALHDWLEGLGLAPEADLRYKYPKWETVYENMKKKFEEQHKTQ